MKSLIGLCMIIATIVLVEGQQRVAPGVPPQQYQQQQYAPPPPPSPHQMQPPQQQMPNQAPQMQQQVQYQQVPVQQQQIPQQHVPVQQQVPVQGVPQQGVHPQGGHPQGGHGHGHGQQQLLNTANIMQEKQHIQEHIDIPMDISKMTEQELQFHYFKMHDADRNDKLDGCELIKSLIHWHGEAAGDEGPKVHTDAELESLVDSILNELDKNSDGFVDYLEYKSAND